MVDWTVEYKKKVVSADEAAKIVKSGDWIEYSFGMTSSCAFDEALAKRRDELKDVKIRCDIGCYPHCTAAANQYPDEVFTWNSWHVSAHDKTWMHKGLYYLPMTFHENPGMTRNDCAPNNIFVAQVSPMDAQGYFSWGAGCASAQAAYDAAKKSGGYCVLEVNPKMPRVHGGFEECVHVTDVDYIIEVNNDMPILGSSAPGAVETKIAENLIPYIPDGATLQLGIGGVPNAVGTALAQSDLKDLGCHTEMLVDAYYEMWKAGKLTGNRKKWFRGKHVFSFMLGSQDLYDWANDNPSVVAAPVDFVNDPAIIRQLDNFISINACVEVDLYGQVSSESKGPRHISGTGGQLDFVIGAYKSNGGSSFICMPSAKTLKDGSRVSCIVPTLDPGTIVTVARTNTHMIATEYGIANMKGKSTWERAEALIGIAHPEFQDELIKAAEKQNIWRKCNKAK